MKNSMILGGLVLEVRRLWVFWFDYQFFAGVNIRMFEVVGAQEGYDGNFEGLR